MFRDNSATSAEAAFVRFAEGFCPVAQHPALTVVGHCAECEVTWSSPAPGFLLFEPDLIVLPDAEPTNPAQLPERGPVGC